MIVTGKRVTILLHCSRDLTVKIRRNLRRPPNLEALKGVLKRVECDKEEASSKIRRPASRRFAEERRVQMKL